MGAALYLHHKRISKAVSLQEHTIVAPVANASQTSFMHKKMLTSHWMDPNWTTRRIRTRSGKQIMQIRQPERKPHPCAELKRQQRRPCNPAFNGLSGPNGQTDSSTEGNDCRTDIKLLDGYNPYRTRLLYMRSEIQRMWDGQLEPIKAAKH